MNYSKIRLASIAVVCVLVIPWMLPSCERAKDSPGTPGGASPDPANFPPIEIDQLKIASSGTVFVPIHTFLPMGDGEHPLEITLGIYNTDPSTSLVVSSIRYYDSAGRLKKEFLQEAHSLAPMASTKFALDGSAKDRDAEGTTASFLIEWESEGPIDEPVVEAIMARWSGTHAYSFVSQGRNIRQPEVPQD